MPATSSGPSRCAGLSPDHTLVLVNGWRRHQTALVNNFTYGMGAGSSGVDLNAMPSSALDRIEVLRDGAAAQYGSDAIAGVVNLVLKDGTFTPFVNGDVGRYATRRLPRRRHHRQRQRRVGHSGRPRLARRLRRVPRSASRPTAPGPTASRTSGTGVADSINDIGQVVAEEQPGAAAQSPLGRRAREGRPRVRQLPACRVNAGRHERVLRASAATATATAPATPTAATRQRPELAPDLSAGLPAEHRGPGDRLLARGRPAGRGVGLELRPRGHVRPQRLRLRDRQHAQRVARPVSRRRLRAGGRRGPRHRRRSRASRTRCSFFAGRVLREELVAALNIARPVSVGLPKPVNLAFGAAFRRERYAIRAGELAS